MANFWRTFGELLSTGQTPWGSKGKSDFLEEKRQKKTAGTLDVEQVRSEPAMCLQKSFEKSVQPFTKKHTKNLSEIFGKKSAKKIAS